MFLFLRTFPSKSRVSVRKNGKSQPRLPAPIGAALGSRVPQQLGSTLTVHLSVWDWYENCRTSSEPSTWKVTKASHDAISCGATTNWASRHSRHSASTASVPSIVSPSIGFATAV